MVSFQLAMFTFMEGIYRSTESMSGSVRLSSGSKAMCQERVHLRLWDCSHWCSLSLGASVSLWNFNPGGSHEHVKNRDGNAI